MKVQNNNNNNQSAIINKDKSSKKPKRANGVNKLNFLKEMNDEVQRVMDEEDNTYPFPMHSQDSLRVPQSLQNTMQK